ncbi:hypothetical protein ACLBOM_32660 [Escherichia coli]
MREQYAPLVKHLEELHNLYKVLDKAREERGGISFEQRRKRSSFSTLNAVLNVSNRPSVMMRTN